VIVVLALLVIAVAIALPVAGWRVAGWADARGTPAPAGPAIAAAPAAAAPAAPALIRRWPGTGVVLVHGIFGFASLGVGPVRVDYFRRVARQLAAAGVPAVAPPLPPLGAVPARAAALAFALDPLPYERVILVAHSMGGLDARWAIAQGWAPRVAALLTIGTPHRGTPVADRLVRAPLAGPALDWLTTARLAGFCRLAPDVPGVRYASIVGATADRARVHPLLRASHAWLLAQAGANDGLVPAASQRWGEVLGEEELDHWAQIGWGRHDAAALLLAALARLDEPARPATGSGWPSIARAA
jgi:triacylglycerol lipase